jgi:nitrite reductase/ring-hydroxylating ferredoxin subunit
VTARVPSRRGVRRVGRWAVGSSNGADFAVSRVCRHQFADLSRGHVDSTGCLVCPWHQSRYDVTTGVMTSGPRGLLWWHGRIPGYPSMIRALARVVPLRVGRVEPDGTVVERVRSS